VRLYINKASQLPMRGLSLAGLEPEGVFGIRNLTFTITQPVFTCGRGPLQPMPSRNLDQLGVIPIQPDGNLRRRFV
jgi:hypothetical protein